MNNLTTKSILFLFSVFLFSGCGSTHMKDTWQAENFSKSSLDKVLVVAATSNKSNRIMFENGLANTLKNKGITASTSYKVLGDAMPTKENVVAYVKNNDINYVIVTKVDNIKLHQDYVPESVTTYYSGYNHYLYNDYDTNTVFRESYVDTQTVVMLVTSVYDAKTEEIVWNGNSETFDINAMATVGSEIAKGALRKMRN